MQKLILFITVLFLVSCANKKKESKKIAENKIIKTKTNTMKKIEFPSKDGLIITADLYEIETSKNFILLCHQAGYSRGEYIATAKKLNTLGYSCMAIDQRSGNTVNGVKNQTALRAKEKGLATKYLDAKQDIEAAINFGYKKNNNKPIIIVGSSYSASLVLLIGAENEKVKAVASFSPGEYLKGVNVTESIKGMVKPIFATSSKKEIEQTAGVLKLVKNVTHFKPNLKGIHGSRMLWESTVGNESCWKSFQYFLNQLN